MWNGSIFKSSFVNHFDVVETKKHPDVGIVEVIIRFHANPEKTYSFDIPEGIYSPSKEAIGTEILSQLRS